MNIMPATIEEPGLDTQRASTLETPPAAPSIRIPLKDRWR
jgi:hypothetical protein